MSNILGEGFSKEIIDQINTRQEKLGLYDGIDDSNLRWRNNKTAWVKLVSSVNIKGSDSYAKNNILFGGISSNDGSSNVLRTGFIENSNSSTYQMSSMGYRPMPGLVSVTIDSLNKGATRKAEIHAVAFSKEQFEIINQLYMSVGFTILLEWGHTVYIDNQGNTQNFSTFNTVPFETFFNGTSNHDDVLKALEVERRKYHGNYDGFYGTVTNFNWSIDRDGVYNMVIKALSVGSVIESLKSNISISSDNEKTDSKDILVAMKDVSTFHNFLFDISKNLPNDIRTKKTEYGKSINFLYPHEISQKYGMNPFWLKKRIFNGDRKWYLFGKEDTSQYYITLGALFDYLQNNINLFISNKDNPFRQKPLVNYDSGSANYCYTYPYQFSADPSTCFIPFNYDIPGINEKVLVFDPSSNFDIQGNDFVANLMEIDISLEFLAKILSELKDDKGKVSPIDLLNRITEGINSALGGVNQLEPFYDEITNTIKIVENCPLNNIDLLERKEYAKFNLYGVSPNLGSFISEINFNVSVSSDFASMIAIGAQANGNQVGENATSISKFYEFYQLKDRILPTKTREPIPPVKIDPEEKTPEEKFKELQTRVSKILHIVYEDNSLTDENIEDLSNANSDMASYYAGYYANLNKIASPFFLPFEVSLEMDGISGVKIYEKFSMASPSDQILPDIYREINGKSKVDFIIKNISHTIQENQWTTNLRSYTIPSMPELTEEQISLKTIISSPLAQEPTDDEDPAVIYNGDAKVGSSPPSSMPVARDLVNRGITNGRIPDNELLGIIIDGKNIGQLNKQVAQSFRDLYHAATAAGYTLNITSAYRSYEKQKGLSSTGRAASAGYSSHGWGAAIDIGNLYSLVGGSTDPKRNLDARKSSSLYRWLAQNAPKYGWYNPWRLSDNYGQSELWHFEYWGR